MKRVPAPPKRQSMSVGAGSGLCKNNPTCSAFVSQSPAHERSSYLANSCAGAEMIRERRPRDGTSLPANSFPLSHLLVCRVGCRRGVARRTDVVEDVHFTLATRVLDSADRGCQLDELWFLIPHCAHLLSGEIRFYNLGPYLCRE